MAAALAASVLPEVTVESAGWAPSYSGVSDKAVSVIREMTGRDISGHRPRDIAELDLDTFDRIIVLDRLVAEELEAIVAPDVTVMVRHVPDPYGGSPEDYRTCAESLLALLKELADEGN